jgi:formamidopyrimidine-DNA glycosylase
MPELPEIETIRRTIGPRVCGRVVSDVRVLRPDLRRPLAADFAARLVGRRIGEARRRAKYLILDLDDGLSWILHFGMSGRLLHVSERSAAVPAKHDHVLVELSDGSALVFNDPRRFGLMVVEDALTSALFAGIGPEPLDAGAFSGGYLAALRARTRRTVKDVLMDQRVVAGLGNIYVNEILFVSGIRPRRRLARLTRADCERLSAATRTILLEAIEHRGSSISDFLDGIGRRGGYQWRRRVYDRAGERCARCGTTIKSVVVGQRSSFYCPRCQR